MLGRIFPQKKLFGIGIGCPEDAVPGGIQEKGRCSTWGHGLVGIICGR